MKIKLSFNDEVIFMNLEDNESAKDFANKLPLKLKFSDYVGKEKVSNTKIKLSKITMNYEPQIGDLFYFSPWENIGIYYKLQPPYAGLILLAKMQDKEDAKKLENIKNDFEIIIEKD